MTTLVMSLLPFNSVAAYSSIPTDGSDRLIIKLKNNPSDNKVGDALKRYGAKQHKNIPKLSTIVVSVPNNQKSDLRNELFKSGDVVYVEYDQIASGSLLANDPSFSKQWYLENNAQYIGGQYGIADSDIDASKAWDIATGTGVKVAILDSGINTSHPDLLGKVVGESNFTNSSTTSDLKGHGTHVAGIVAATSNNGKGVAGGCLNCQLLNGKVLGDDGSGWHSWISDGIVWATDNGAKVINLSLGGTSGSTLLNEAVDYAWAKGVVVVAAAGNNGSTTKFYPAAYANALAVASTDNKDVKSGFSNYGSGWVDVAAPGSYIYSTLLGSSYGYMSGTSMATPIVAATAALVWSGTYGTSASSVRDRLEQSVDKITGSGTYWAHGRINAASALGYQQTTTSGDITPPKTPLNLRTTSVKAYKVALSWYSSTDNVAVKGYTLLRDGLPVASTTSTSFVDSNLVPNTSYSYRVIAFDAAGNISNPSNEIIAKTLGVGVFTGKVTSSTGAPISNAVLTFYKQGIYTTVYTDSNGAYISPDLEIGSYSVRVTRQGFYTQSKSVTLTTNSTIVIDFVLKLN